VLGGGLAPAVSRPGEVVMLPVPARPQPGRDWQGAVLPLQLGQRLDARRAVRSDHEEPALGPGRDADVSLGPVGPPTPDDVLVRGRVLQPPAGPRVLARAVAAVLAAAALAVRDGVQGHDAPPPPGVSESGLQEVVSLRSAW